MTVLGVILHLLFTANLWQATLAAAVLLLLPALGGTISERTGVVNIAMEGMMLTGAFFGVVADLAWHNVWAATGVAMLAGGLMASVHAIVSIQFRADQIVSGIAINIFAAGLTVFLINRIYGLQDVGHLGQSDLLPNINVPVLDQLPFIGQVLFQQNIIVYVALILLVATQIVLFRTKLGLRMRAVGEHPMAADTAGINVFLIRYGAVITSGVLSGLSGAFLAIGVSNTFSPNMTDGRGYIALAAMIFGKWTPLGAFVACLIFGLGEAIYANNSIIHVSQYLLNMLPYLITLVVLAGVVGRSTPPAHDGLPYIPGAE
ncbi:MAG TPA: ABC transporter permease [Candidatus Dormibacteraeota bacterium]|jgi:simple sugar transport system permease protein|nr:ABC transporter permease [Candidatus Dormibacteraeota bacterium]HEX2681043.1 ABC transporter permease [Candidatus Dormibacteraeota bacterium]